MLRFSDGVSIDTSGRYRAVRLSDGWYVVGHGLCSPEADERSAKQYVDELEKRANGQV